MSTLSKHTEYALALTETPLEEQSLVWTDDLLKIEQKVSSHNYRYDDQAHIVTRTVTATEPVLYQHPERDTLVESLNEAFHKDGTLQEFKEMNSSEQTQFVNKVANLILHHFE